MDIMIGLALGLLIGGLLICLLSSQASNPALVGIFWWAGIICAVIGLVLLVFPVLAWVHGQLRAAIGH